MLEIGYNKRILCHRYCSKSGADNLKNSRLYQFKGGCTETIHQNLSLYMFSQYPPKSKFQIFDLRASLFPIVKFDSWYLHIRFRASIIKVQPEFRSFKRTQSFEKDVTNILKSLEEFEKNLVKGLNKLIKVQSFQI